MGFQPDPATDRLIDTYRTTEVGGQLRISFEEPYILRRGTRIFQDSPWPKFYLEGMYGFDNDFLGADYGYTKAQITMTDKMRLGRFGWVNYVAQAGKIWGTLPFPALNVFKGSQSYSMQTAGYSIAGVSSMLGTTNVTAIYDQVSFNLMYFYEFVADEWISAAFDWHTEGYLIQKIPGLRETKIKELFTGRLAWGRLSEANQAQNYFFDNITGDRLDLRAPDDLPYMEVGVGIENLFKFLRIDYIWRLSYLNPEVPTNLSQFHYNHGVRFYVTLSF
jgi:hypothetical protein